MSDKWRDELAKLKPTPKPVSEYRSVEVKKPERAGRAPYNFVPLTEGEWKKAAAPPDQNKYSGTSGEILIQIAARTDFYLRGMQPLAENNRDKPTSNPFQVDGQMRLPGTSLRGMIRNLVEILGKAPLSPVNDDQLFFRAVAAVPEPSMRTSFEPQAKAYKDRIGGGPTGLKVLPGYMYCDKDSAKWKIRPAMQPALYRQYSDKSWDREEIGFQLGRPPMVEKVPNRNDGWAIYSGPMQGKEKQWVIPAEDTLAKAIPIPKADVEAYLEGGQVVVQDLGLTRDERSRLSREETNRRRREAEDRFRYRFREQGDPRFDKSIPCFYVKWTVDGCEHVSFGHTPFFRLPYRNSTAKAIPAEWRRDVSDTRWDVAQSLFGRIPAGKDAGRRGRVFFEDAMLIEGEQAKYETSVILGTPKPTTYQHYLVQKSEEVQNSIHWDGDYKGTREVTPRVRGHKAYWHRPGAPLISAKPSSVSSTIRKGLKGAQFRALIRFENLSEIELGLLLTAIELPYGCAHRLGMGKPLGLGSMHLQIEAVNEIDREERYSSFGSVDGEIVNLKTGTSKVGPDRIKNLKSAFSVDYKPAGGDLWQDPRLAELKALLTLDGLPADWENRTRYLEFGQTRELQTYNEFQHVGYPKSRDLQKRRPLPPATQVLNDRRLPADPRPEFREPR